MIAVMTDDSLPIIDAHHHFWKLGYGHHPWLEGAAHAVAFRYGDYAAIRGDYLVADFLADHGRHRIVKSVHMEAEWDPADPVAETRWIHALHDESGWPHAAVGQACFTRDDIAEVVAGHAAYPLIRSVRQKPAAAPSPAAFVAGAPGSMADPAFRAGFGTLARHGLHYDLQAPWWHLGEAADLARDFPDTLIILNHTGLPADRTPEGLAGWREGMERFAAQPNTAVKISGIGVPGHRWTPDLQRDVVLETLRLFGADRCMAASNFPVDSLCASYDEIFSTLKALTTPLPDADRRALFHDTAMRIYWPV
jgi:predicted TIM-barrel fold metal-dependent hydrolase